MDTQIKTEEQVTPAKHISKIISGDVTYSYDPEKMTVRQWEAAEKELIAADYYELMREHGAYCALPNVKVKFYTAGNAKDEEEFKILAAQYAEDDKSENAETAREYWKRRTMKANNYSKTLQTLHSNLLRTGGRLRMIGVLLTPSGQPYSELTAHEVDTKVIPTMTQKEAEDVLSNFLNSPQLVEHLSLNYLREYTPQSVPPKMQE